MFLYPVFDACSDEADVSVSQNLKQTSAQTFRLHKIGELESFLRSEVESRGRLHKKKSQSRKHPRRHVCHTGRNLYRKWQCWCRPASYWHWLCAWIGPGSYYRRGEPV